MIQESGRKRGVKQVLVIAVWLTVALVTLGPPAWIAVTYFTQGEVPSWSGLDWYIDPNGEFHSPKTLWDVWELLIIPAALGLGVYWLNRQERKAEREAEDRRTEAELKVEGQRAQSEREIALDRSREDALQRYLDCMTELILDRGLRASETGAEVRDIARARTLTVLRAIDGGRKGEILQFLHDSGLINRDNAVIGMLDVDLTGANLTLAILNETDLSWAKLSGATLFGAYLQRANLSWAILYEAKLLSADLSEADLSHASLIRANLSNTNLCSANLDGATLSEANLEGAILSRADLTRAVVKDKQLEQAKSLKDATMPDGSYYDGRFNLEGDIELARKQGVNTDDPEAMALWFASELTSPDETNHS